MVGANFARSYVLRGGGVKADDFIPDYYAEPGLAGQRHYPQDIPQEFIDPFGGKLRFSFVDIHLPGNTGLDITVRRNYSANEWDNSYHSPYLGMGWLPIHFGRVLRRASADMCATITNDLPVLELSDGSRQPLHKVDAGTPAEYSGYFLVTKQRWVAQCVGGRLQARSPEGVRYTFAACGGAASGYACYATEIRDRNDQHLDISYANDTDGIRVTQIQDPADGRRVQFTYAAIRDVPGLWLERVTDGRSNWFYHYTLAQAFAGNPLYAGYRFLTSVTLPTGNSWQFVYDDVSPLTQSKGALLLKKVTYPSGGTTAYTYDRVAFDPSPVNPMSTVVVRKTSAGSGVVPGTWIYTYQPGPSGDITIINGPTRTETYKHFGYQAAPVAGGNSANGVWKIGVLLEKTVGTQTESYTWEGQRISDIKDGAYAGGRAKYDPDTYAPLLTQKTIQRDGTNYTTIYANFDNYGNAQKVTETGNASRTTDLRYYFNPTYWIINQAAQETLAGVGTIDRVFDSRGRVTRLNEYGVTTDYTYHTSGALATRREANGNQTSFLDYYRGIARDERHPEGVNLSRGVDTAGNVTAYTDGRGSTTGFSWDGLNRLTSINFPPGHTDVTINYDLRGNKTLTRGNFRETVDLDGFGRPTQIDRGTIVTAIRYDALGQKTFESYPGSALGTTYTYDALGRATLVRHGDGDSRSYAYGSGNTVTVRNERGLNTTSSYLAYGDPEDSVLTQITDPVRTTAIARNLLGQISSVTQNGKTRSYGYNSQKFLTSIADPETGTTTFGRDNVGNMTSRKVGNAGAASFSYDGLNRLIHINYPATEDASFSYDANGNLLTANNSLTSWSGTYDARNKPLTERLVVDGKTFQVAFSYDSLDGLDRITYPGGHTITYSPDVLGRPTTASPYLTNVDYHPNRQMEQMNYANSRYTSTTLTSRQWLETLRVNNGSYLSLNYDYDGRGNVVRLDRQDNYDLHSFSYDGADRLTEVTGAWGYSALSYDADGDISRYRVGSETLAYTYDGSNRPSQITQSGVSNPRYRFSYDAYGNITDDTQHTYSYDDASRLRTVDGGIEQYTYDAHGHRVKRVRGTQVTYFFPTRAGQLLGEYNVSATWLREFMQLEGKQIAVVENLATVPSIKIVPSSTELVVPEGGTTYLTVALEPFPFDGAPITVTGRFLSGGDASLSIPGGVWSQVYDPKSKQPWVALQVNAATDPDTQVGQAWIELTAPGLDSVLVRVREQEPIPDPVLTSDQAVTARATSTPNPVQVSPAAAHPGAASPLADAELHASVPLFYDGFGAADLSAWNWLLPGSVDANRLEVSGTAALGSMGIGDCGASVASRCGLSVLLADAAGSEVLVGLTPLSVLRDEPAVRGRFWLDPSRLMLSEFPEENRLLIAEFSQASAKPEVPQPLLRFYLERRAWEGYWLRVEHWDAATQTLREAGTGYLTEAELEHATPVWLEFTWRAGNVGQADGEFGLYELSAAGTRLLPPLVERLDLYTAGQGIASVRFGALNPLPLGAAGSLSLDEIELWREE